MEVSEIGTIKYGLENSDPRGTVLERPNSKSKLQTRPLVREDATKYQTRNCLKEISGRKKIWSRALIVAWHKKRLAETVGRKIILTSNTRH
jgi:hypothetical protein